MWNKTFWNTKLINRGVYISLISLILIVLIPSCLTVSFVKGGVAHKRMFRRGIILILDELLKII